MTQIDYRIGDMFKGGHKYIAHGCNAQGVMGSGVAAIVNDNYHYAYVAYSRVYQADGLELGQVIPASVSHTPTKDKPKIFNCITQDHYGTDQRYANYGAIQECVHWINAYMASVRRSPIELATVAFPMIGAGLAGGDWGIISKIIERGSRSFQPVVYDFTP